MEKVIFGVKAVIVLIAGMVVFYGIWQIGQIKGEYEEAELEYELLAEQYTEGMTEERAVSGNSGHEAEKDHIWVDFNALKNQSGYCGMDIY